MATKRKINAVVVEFPFGGWIPTLSGSNAANSLSASMQGKEGQYGDSSAISLFRLEKHGHISPGEIFSALTDATPRINQLPLNGGVSSSGFAYIVLANGRIVIINTTPATAAFQDVTVAGTHSGHTVTTSNNADVIGLFDQNTTPSEFILFSWEDGTDADVDLVAINSSGTISGYVNGWFSSLSGSAVLTKGVPLKMIQGPDGNVYITNKNYIATVTVAKGSALTNTTTTKGNAQALYLGPNFVATGIARYGNYIAICASQLTTFVSGISRSDSRVFLWDGFSPNPNFVYDIPDNYAQGIFNDGKDLYLFTSGRNNASTIWKYTSNGFDDSFTSALVPPGGSPIQGSIESYQSGLQIAANSNRIYQFYQNGFHNRTIVTDGTNQATSIGMLKNLTQGQLYVGVGIAGGLYKIYYQSDFSKYYTPATFKTRLFELPYKANIKKIRVYFSQFGTGASVLFSLYKDYDNASDLLGVTITNATLGPVSSYTLPMQIITDVSSFYMKLTFNHASVSNLAAIIRRIEIIYEPTDKM